MARGQPVISINGHRRRIGHGMWQLDGKIGLAAGNSSYNMSVIERHFRRCQHVQVALNSGFLAHWNQSVTHLNGTLEMYNSTTDDTGFDQAGCTVCSGVFTATGM